MNKLVSKLFKLIPEGGLKNNIRCAMYNRMQSDFRISYSSGRFTVEKDGYSMVFNENPYQQFLNDRDYFHKYRVQPGDTLIDGGAFRGMLVVYAAKLVGADGLVIALEPDPEQYDRLVKNIELNKVTNVRVIKKGLWSSTTTLKFRSGKELSSSFIKADEENSENIISVPVTTIDEILAGDDLKGKLLIKMNIEGAEIEAVKGANATIKKYRPHFVIRTNHNVEGRYTDDRVSATLKGYGYNPETKVLHEQTTFA